MNRIPKKFSLRFLELTPILYLYNEMEIKVSHEKNSENLFWLFVLKEFVTIDILDKLESPRIQILEVFHYK